MKLNFVKDEMSSLLENINDQFELINQHETNIPQIELDLFMRNIQKLYENTIYLNKISKTDEQITTVEAIIPEEPEKVVEVVEAQAEIINEY